MIRHRYLCPSRRLWILATLFILTGAAPAPPCHLISDSESFTQWKDCDYNDLLGVGNAGSFVALDFSDVSEAEIVMFFSTRPKLVAGIRIVGNKDLTTLNLGKVTTWSPRYKAADDGKVLIEIANNPKLKTIQLGATALDILGVKVRVLLYNNPSLTLSDDMANLLTKQWDADKSLIERDPNVCQFQYPIPSTGAAKYFKPTADFLSHCNIIKGDLDMNDVALPNNITLDANTAGCLRLVKVDTSKGKLIFDKAGKGVDECKHDSVKSEIRDNPGLCGDELAAFEGYFKPGSKATIQPASDTCTIACNEKQAVNKYHRCSSITADADISGWFSDPALMENRDKLQSATGVTLTIANSNLANLTLPLLSAAKGLVITDNAELEDIYLPQLTTIETLKLEGNKKLTLDKLKKLKIAVTTINQSKIECHTVASGQDEWIEKVEDFWHCTVIKGKLMLKGLQTNIKEGEVSLKEVDGCLTIEKTKFTNLDFLKNVPINCIRDKNHLLDNEELCPPTWLKNVATFGKNKEIGCGGTCTDLNQGNCTIFIGNLIINSSTAEDELKDLEIIRGSLIMEGTTHVQLDLPKMIVINASKAPAIVVKNNAQLKQLKMGNIETVTAPGQPLVEVSGNPQLESLEAFLPSSISPSCKAVATGMCYFAEYKTITQEAGIAWWVYMTVGIVAFVFLAAAVGLVFYCLRRMEKRAIQREQGKGDGFTDLTGGKPTAEAKKKKTATSSEEKLSADNTKNGDSQDDTQSGKVPPSKTLADEKKPVGKPSHEPEMLKSSLLEKKALKNDDLKRTKDVRLGLQDPVKNQLDVIDMGTGRLEDRDAIPQLFDMTFKKINKTIPNYFHLINFLETNGEKTQRNDFEGTKKKPASSLQPTLLQRMN